MRISDWSSDVCSSDLELGDDLAVARRHRGDLARGDFKDLLGDQRGGRALRRVLETRHRLGQLQFETFGRSHRGQGFAAAQDRKTVVTGKGVSVGVNHGVRRINKKKKKINTQLK